MFKTNKIISLFTIFTISTTATIAFAQHNNIKIENNYFFSTAKVTNIEPIIKNIQISTPRRECWQEEISRPVYTHQNRGHGNALFGGIIGGIVGNQFGRGDGKTAATVVGSIIGATVGNDITQQQHRTTRSERVDVEQHCKVTHTSESEQRIEGYWVTYRYKDEIFTTRMNEQPGEHLKIRVQVTPVFD